MLSDGEKCQELDLAEIRNARRSLQSETDVLEYKKEQFNIQMEREKQNLKRAHWKLEAKSKLSEDKIELEKVKLSSEKEVLCAKSSDQEAREAQLTKDKKLNLLEMENRVSHFSLFFKLSYTLVTTHALGLYEFTKKISAL